MKASTILIINLLLLPSIGIVVGVVGVLEISGIQHTPAVSWVAIGLLASYAMLKLDLKKIMEDRKE